ncbi:MAG: GIY-YIG nuclease family protein [Sphingomicrobium sp.]
MGGWVYIMANHYRGGMYVGVTADLAARVYRHREGQGSVTVRDKSLTRLVWADQFARIDEAIAQEKRVKRWRREWKFALIEAGNPEWVDLYEMMHW